MSLIFNGTTIASNYTVSFNGTNLTAIVYNGTQVWTKGTYSLVASVFNSSGTFTVPSGVTSIVVACTGGGGGPNNYFDYCGNGWGGPGGGSGRTSGTFSVTPGQTFSVTVGSGGASRNDGSWGGYSPSGGTSSFGSLLSCAGGGGCAVYTDINHWGSGVSGGGNGYPGGTTSNCAAVLTLSGGAIDTSGGLYTAKSYSTPGAYAGGAGCYGLGGYVSGTTNINPVANSGGGGGTDGQRSSYGASGKVVVFYYAYV